MPPVATVAGDRAVAVEPTGEIVGGQPYQDLAGKGAS
jgi:hypothetical protein